MTAGTVVAVALAPAHSFSKSLAPSIELEAGLGVRGDAHAGSLVKHRSRVAKNPDQPNLRQVHLVHAELFDMLRKGGWHIRPGDIGENITTAGIDLLALPRGAILELGDTAAVEITGLRNPCHQLNDFSPGLMKAVLEKTAGGRLIRKAGVMAIALRSGVVRPGDQIHIVLPAEPHQPLEPV